MDQYFAFSHRMVAYVEAKAQSARLALRTQDKQLFCLDVVFYVELHILGSMN